VTREEFRRQVVLHGMEAGANPSRPPEGFELAVDVIVIDAVNGEFHGAHDNPLKRP
jgi:hypothetical protein